jgi:hypothetical protein
LRRGRKEVVWVFGATCSGSGWALSPLNVAKELNKHFGIRLEEDWGFPEF